MRRREPRWLPRLVVEAIHVDQMREHGGFIGLRDEMASLAAVYAYGLSSNHPFRDGNKRVSFVAVVVFLGLNGMSFSAPDDEVVEKSLALAAGELEEADLAEWIRSRSQPTN